MYLPDSSLAAVEEVLDPCEAESSSPSSSSSPRCFRGETAAGAMGSLNFTVWLPGAAELVLGGGFLLAARPAEGASSSESELTSWWVYWWISFSLRIIWRLGKGRTPNLHRGDSQTTDGEEDNKLRKRRKARQTKLTVTPGNRIVPQLIAFN